MLKYVPIYMFSFLFMINIVQREIFVDVITTNMTRFGDLSSSVAIELKLVV